MLTECSVEIERPIEDVFDYTINHVADWSITVVEDEALERTPEGVGSTFRIVTEDRGRRMEFQGITTVHEPPTASALLMTGRCFDIDAEYSFDDLGEGRTRVTVRSVVKGKGLTTVMFLLLGWFMRGASCRAMDAELASLKSKLEAKGQEA